MHYVLLIYGNESANLPREAQAELHQAFVAYTEAMHKAGVLHANHGLRPTSESKTVRHGHVHDGPAVDHEHILKGYYLIDVTDMHSAIEWAKRCPAAKFDAIEVRAVWA